MRDVNGLLVARLNKNADATLDDHGEYQNKIPEASAAAAVILNSQGERSRSQSEQNDNTLTIAENTTNFAGAMNSNPTSTQKSSINVINQ